MHANLAPPFVNSLGRGGRGGVGAALVMVSVAVCAQAGTDNVSAKAATRIGIFVGISPYDGKSMVPRGSVFVKTSVWAMIAQHY